MGSDHKFLKISGRSFFESIGGSDSYFIQDVNAKINFDLLKSAGDQNVVKMLS